MASKIKSKKSRKIKRKCLACGKKIIVEVFPDGKYLKGHYFGTLPALNKGTGKDKEIEYWECEKCINEE